MMKSKYSRLRIILAFLIIVTFFFTNILFKINSDIRLVKVLYYTGHIVFSLLCFMIIKKIDIKKLNYGLTFIIMAYFIELITEYIKVNETFLFVAIATINTLGIILTITGSLGALNNIRELNNDLAQLAYYDTLTKLPNENYLKSACKKIDLLPDGSCKHCGFIKKIIDREKAAFLFLDIDDFKLINDYTGHRGGDTILISFSERLKHVISKEDLLLRISGDEFLIIIKNTDELSHLENFIQKIHSSINTPFMVKEKEIDVTSSIGVALYPEHGTDLESLMIKADIALFHAKQYGKNNYFIFQEHIKKEFNTRFEDIIELKEAIKKDEFIMYYQPKANLKTGEITGLEALIRWNHPKKGIVGPMEFIKMAEEIFMIDKIDYIVINHVLKQIASWQEIGQKPLNISINISPQFFLNKHFISVIDSIFSKYTIDPSYISFEITENISLHDIEYTKKTLDQLKRRKIKIHIDDFGKGYSSIAYLKDFIFDYLKIDKTFIDGIIHSKIDRALIEMVVNLSNLAGFRVISEGVETKEQLEFLKSIGCHEYQGYLLSKPLPLEKLNIKK